MRDHTADITRTLCLHKDETSKVVSSTMTSTTYRNTCDACGRIFYVHETIGEDR